MEMLHLLNPNRTIKKIITHLKDNYLLNLINGQCLIFLKALTEHRYYNMKAQLKPIITGH